MKITKSKLREIILEEYKKLNEITSEWFDAKEFKNETTSEWNDLNKIIKLKSFNNRNKAQKQLMKFHHHRFPVSEDYGKAFKFIIGDKTIDIFSRHFYMTPRYEKLSEMGQINVTLVAVAENDKRIARFLVFTDELEKDIKTLIKKFKYVPKKYGLPNLPGK